MTVFRTVAEVGDAVGECIGTSRWFDMDQSRIDAFAEVTEDRQWIHVDPERAAHGPFGSTVAHGYLTLALAAPIVEDVLHVENLGQGVNYGLGKVRFPAPVRAGAKVRGTVTVKSADPVPGGLHVELLLVVEVVGGSRPACVAELLLRLYGSSDG
jgi:acyl dehydratase